jgi:3-phosphoshikimate 1-carboxyvinyltransferase
MSAPARVSAGTALGGTTAVPGDKSIAHRALLLGALADGASTVRGLPDGADVRATLGAIRSLGAGAAIDGDTVRIEGRGLELGAGLAATLACANSGTTMRLGMGLVAGVAGRRVLDGDGSLRRRPMERVAVPLRAMGAAVATTGGRAPVTVDGARLRGVDYASPVASAQVKSAVLLAGLRADGTTRVVEPLPTRDHTERMLRHMGVAVTTEGARVALAGGQRLRPLDVTLPGDPSSAAFLVVAALLVPGSRLRIARVGLNPLRTGAFEVLRRMGARITVEAGPDEGGEPCGDVLVEHGPLRATAVAAEEVPAAIDELPILAVAAAFADGDTRVAGAAELRIKESDRIAALEQLRALGVAFDATADGFVVRGRPDARIGSGSIATHGDHRIAMAFAVAGLRSAGGVAVDDPACADVSFPGFFTLLRTLGARVEERGGA